MTMSAFEEATVSRQFRQTLPSGHYDMIIVSLVHQKNNMIWHIADNIKKYVHGRFLWIVHCNSEIMIDENTLPDFAWMVRNPIKTTGHRWSVALTHGICRALEFAIENVTFTNALMMSSGSAFFRHYDVPTFPRIGLINHTSLLSLSRGQHTMPVPIERIESSSSYILENGSEIPWLYDRFEKDIPIHHLFKKFKWLKGGQWSGSIFPYEVAKDVAADMKSVEAISYDTTLRDYAREEIVFSTYAYNYAVTTGMTINMLETITDWDYMYNPTIERVIQYRSVAALFPGIGHLVCRLEDNYEGTREFLMR